MFMVRSARQKRPNRCVRHQPHRMEEAHADGGRKEEAAMKEPENIRIWKEEENIAHIHGRDFSHIAGRYTEETDLPRDYRQIIQSRLKPEMKLLDVDTGGGELLLSLHHPIENTGAAGRPILQMLPCAGKRCSHWGQISGQGMERTSFRLRMPRST